MGFYGNITNTSNTTFSFDRIYPNRLAMDANANNDGIFIGRYVLVEYQENAAYPVAYHATLVDGSNTQYYFYSSTNQEEISKIKYLGPTPDEPEHLPSVDDVNAIYQDGFYKGEILQYYIYSSEKKDWIFSEEFYICVGEIGGYAIFEKIETPSMKSNYIQNFEIDENHYGQESKGFKGYDSTVWVKSSVEQNGKLVTKYVNIADLNSVVPTFDIAADAPTMEPVTPHFDADSTNVYYKLHAQTPYGFRVKAETNEKLSDEKTKHYKVTYNKDSNITISEFTNPDAAIYYNKEAFRAKPYVDEITGEIIPVVKKDTTTINEIKVQPSGYTDNYVNKYSHKPTSDDPDLVGDIQEFSLHLPAIGNMMSDAWDIIHGPNRDDARTDKNGSLQGRLDSFKDINENQIPVKRSNDGTLVGTNINGNKPRVVNDITTEGLHIDDKTQDDAWIKTIINTTELTDAKNKNNNGISIHHTFHADNTDYDFSTNKNKDGVNSNSNYDKIRLYTPSVDAAGHVVGGGYETVTLPYGYKYIETNNSSLKNAAPASVNGTTQTADSTQDTIKFNASNKWIKLDSSEEDIIKFGHIVEDIEIEDNNDTDLNDEETRSDKINIPDWSYDEAGHIRSKQSHTYILPFGYKSFSDEKNNASVANNTQDEFIFAGDSWLESTVEQGKITYSHIGPVEGEQRQEANKEPKFGDTFVIEDWTFDEKGHKNTLSTHTVKIPQGSYTPANNAEKHTDIITSIGFTPSSGAITSTKATTGTLTLSNYSANNGNLNILYTDSINEGFEKIQNHINSLDMSSISTTEFITEITQTDGQVAVKRAAAGTLQLGTTSTDATIPATSSLNNAFNITNARIKKEEDALAKEIQDRKDAIDALTGTKDYSEHFDTMKEIADWLDANKDGVVDITLNITANTKAISDEAALARSEEGKLAYAIETEELRAQDAEAELQNQIDSLGTAASSQVEDFATAAQGLLAETAIQPGTEFIYTEEFKDADTGEILIPEIKMTIEALVKKVAELENEIKILKGE